MKARYVSLRFFTIDEWAYTFFKICDMSFKGPGELRSKFSELRRQRKQISLIEDEDKPRLEELLRKHIQPAITGFKEYFEKTSNESCRRYYQHHFNHLLWILKNETHTPYTPNRVVEYLEFVKRKSKDCYYYREPLLCMMAVLLYNLEMKK